MSGPASAAWTCPTRKVAVAKPFCSTCGEKHKHPREFTFAGLMAMVYSAFSPIDGKLLRSILHLVRYPGRLTRAYQHGQRMPYMGPFQLFLIVNVAFFAVQSAGAFTVFTQTLAVRLSERGLFTPLAKILTDAHLARIEKSFEAYAPVFDQAISVNAKSLIGLMVPPFALLLPLVFWGRGQPLAVNMVFSLHFYSFLLILLAVPVVAMEISILLGGPAVPTILADQAMSVALLLSCAVYLYVAIGPVFEARGAMRVFQAAILAIAVAAFFLAYRFLLMPITFHTT